MPGKGVAPAIQVDAGGAYLAYWGDWQAVLKAPPPFTSRKVKVTVNTSKEGQTFIGVCLRQNWGGEGLQVCLDSHNQNVGLYGNELLASASVTLAPNTEHSLEVFQQSNDRPGADLLIGVYLDGVFLFSHVITAAEVASKYHVTNSDGLTGYYGAAGTAADDGWSRLTNFTIDQCSDLPYVAAGTAALVAGSPSKIAVANTAITANSKVRVWNEEAKGTVGALSVAIEPGTGFTVTSANTADKSLVYYEIVSY